MSEVACWNEDCEHFDRPSSYAGMGKCKLNVTCINSDGECEDIKIKESE